VIFTTHQAHLGEPIANRTMTMRAGKIASDLRADGADA
jgi:ABC-type glutathione transport system ATPase component